METFLETSFQNVRSSKRTDEFHNALLDEVLNANSTWAEYDWQFEYQLPVDGFGGTFDIDIAGFVNGQLKVAILGKAINSNVNKNIKNYANTSIGEAARIMYAPNVVMEKVLFVTVLPRIAPRFNTKKEVVGFDDVISAKNRTKINDILTAQYSGKVEAIDLFFDIEGVKTLTNFDLIEVKNLDALTL
ncbi:MAG: hypothetical protein ACO38Q_07190 [Aquiluna sp.]|jgi:hypothetical protein